MKKILFFISILLVNTTFAQTVTIGGGASITCPATPTATFTPAVTGVTFSNWSRGSGVTCASANNGLNGAGFNTANVDASFAANKYYAITITSTTHKFEISSIMWNVQVSNTTGSPAFGIKYSVNGAPAANLGSAGTSTTSNAYSGSVSVGYGENVVIYFIPTGLSASGTSCRVLNGSTITLANVLPVNLTSFEAKNIANNKNELTFRTASETNNAYFEIERSADGSNFTTIGRVEGNGTTIEAKSYTFVDETAKKGVNYYRLKQVDNDGRYEYSMMKTAFNGSKRLEASIVNVDNRSIILNLFSENDDDAIIQILDMNGRLMSTHNESLQKENNRIVLNTDLPSGMFVVSIRTSAGLQVNKTMVIK